MATILHGDCLELMKTLPDKSVDCFVCDLPQGCLTSQTYKGVVDKSNADLGERQGSKITWDIKIDLVAFWEQVKRLCKDDHTPVLMFCSTKFGAELIASNPDWFRQDLVWAKTNAVGFLAANKMPLRAHEMIQVFAKKGAQQKRVDITGDFPPTVGPNHRRSQTSNTYPRVADKPSITSNYNFGPHHSRGKATESTTNVYNGGKPLRIIEGSVQDCAGREKPIERVAAREGIRCVKSVLTVANKKGKGRHPTQKPDELYQWLLERQCPAGGTILDPTAGSFSACRVGLALGLKVIGIEKDDGFFEKFGKPLTTEKDPKVEGDEGAH